VAGGATVTVFDPALLNGLGVGALVVAMFVMLSTGMLVVRSVYKAALEEKEYWRQAFFKEHEAAQEILSQNTQLMDTSKLTQAAFEAALRTTSGDRDGTR